MTLENTQTLYDATGATPLGDGQHLPIGSLLDKELLSLLIGYRRTVAGNYKALLIDEVETRLEDGPMTLSPKIDGELWFLIFDKGQAVLSNTRGRMIVGAVPFLEECQQAAQHCTDRTIIAGELFAAKPPKSGRSRVGDVSSAMAGGTAADVKRLGFAAFDLVQGGDNQAAMPLVAYVDRMAVLNRILEGKKRVKPVSSIEIKSRAELAEYYEKWVTSQKFEGIVIRTAVRTYKLKPSFTVDAVIIGYTTREDDPTQLRSMALCLMRKDGTLQYICNCGNMSTDTRKSLLTKLQGTEIKSTNWRLGSSDGALFRFVKPELVVEIKATDVQSEDSSGKTLRTMTLSYENDELMAIRKQPAAALLFPVFVRIREDKTVCESDIRINQVLERTLVADTDTTTEKIELPTSSVIKRAVYKKTSKKGVAVRKLVLWKTNKEEIDPQYPAYVVHWTDYSPGRKDPLKREVRLAPNADSANQIADQLLKDNVKKGWIEA